MKTSDVLSDQDIVNIVQEYYAAVDSRDADRLAALYLDEATTTLKFNADPAIVTVDAIKEFTAGFSQAVAGIRHTMIEIWANPLLGNIVPIDLEPSRTNARTVVSTATPVYSFFNGSSDLALPAASVFTIDIKSRKFISVHNLFDIGQVYSALKKEQ